MTRFQQRAELQRRIWQIANDVHGAVDGWDFKQYVLGSLFYRFISENFAGYIEGGDKGVNYTKLTECVITPEIKDDAIKTKGYFIYPSQLFSKVAAPPGINVQVGDTLQDARFNDDKPFDAIVSNPPDSVKWIGGDDSTLINDDPFAPAGVLAPKSKADFTFVLLALSYLSSKGRAAIVCFPGIFYFAQSVPFENIAANDYNLSVSSYVEAKDTREVVDIAQLNAELKTTVAKIDRLRQDIDQIVAEIEGTQMQGARA
jgi:type I restriction-modification system DNA methylase subunit